MCNEYDQLNLVIDVQTDWYIYIPCYNAKLRTCITFSGGCRPTQKQLMQQLYTTVPDKWRAIGTYLEIPTVQLNSLDKQYHGNPQECLMAMLTEGWLPRVTPPPTWQEIAEAVEFVGHPDVAQKLRQKFCK